MIPVPTWTSKSLFGRCTTLSIEMPKVYSVFFIKPYHRVYPEMLFVPFKNNPPGLALIACLFSDVQWNSGTAYQTVTNPRLLWNRCKSLFAGGLSGPKCPIKCPLACFKQLFAQSPCQTCQKTQPKWETCPGTRLSNKTTLFLKTSMMTNWTFPGTLPRSCSQKVSDASMIMNPFLWKLPRYHSFLLAPLQFVNCFSKLKDRLINHTQI